VVEPAGIEAPPDRTQVNRKTVFKSKSVQSIGSDGDQYVKLEGLMGSQPAKHLAEIRMPIPAGKKTRMPR
jgi:hypothetical protein